jgi:predicted dehydrogenase
MSVKKRNERSAGVDKKSRPMKIGVLGAGNVSKQSHLPVLVNMPEVSISWVCDSLEDRARDAARAFKVPAFFSDIEKCTEVDAVLVAVPVGHRKKVMSAIFERGEHVFCEKPFALRLSEHDEYLAGARKHGVEVAVGLVRRYARPTLMARRIVSQGAFGPVLSVRAFEGFRMKRTGQESGWYIGDPSLVGGGVLMETGAHLVDQVLFVLGSSDFSIESCRQQKYRGIDFASMVKARLAVPSQEEVECSVEISWLEDLSNGIFIEFPSYVLKVGLFFEQSLELLSKQKETICCLNLDHGAGTVVEGFFLEWTDFLAQCASSKPSLVDAGGARQTTSFIQKCYEDVTTI